MARIVRKQLQQEDDIDMALVMKPIPIKLTPDVLAMLRSEAELTGVHQNEIARRVLKEWADRKVHVANVINKHLKRAGFEGLDGTIAEDQE